MFGQVLLFDATTGKTIRKSGCLANQNTHVILVLISFENQVANGSDRGIGYAIKPGFACTLAQDVPFLERLALELVEAWLPLCLLAILSVACMSVYTLLRGGNLSEYRGAVVRRLAV